MGDLATYSLVDFFPIGREVYLRMFVRLNESVWPAQFLAVILGVAALALPFHLGARTASPLPSLRSSTRGRLIATILAAAWISVGWCFFLDLYANLNWVATYVGWAFVTQGALLLAAGLLGRLDPPDDQPHAAPARAGLALATFGVALFPLLGPLTGRSWSGVELVGLAPDPTVIATLGLLLTANRARWYLLPVPLLWCAAAGATGWVMGTPGGLVTAGCGLLATLLALWRVVSLRGRG